LANATHWWAPRVWATDSGCAARRSRSVCGRSHAHCGQRSACGGLALRQVDSRVPSPFPRGCMASRTSCNRTHSRCTQAVTPVGTSCAYSADNRGICQLLASPAGDARRRLSLVLCAYCNSGGHAFELANIRQYHRAPSFILPRKRRHGAYVRHRMTFRTQRHWH